MTVLNAINRFDLLYPNALSHEQKRRLLSGLDGIFYEEVEKHYENAPTSFTGYPDAADETKTLLIPFPDDDIYIKYLAAENDLINGDISRYNNASQIFNASYSDFVRRYHREHTMKTENRIKI